MTQPELFPIAIPFGVQPLPKFDGSTFNPEHDAQRLNAQYRATFALMEDGQWRTLSEIAEAVAAPQASVSARLRDMRKAKFGGHTVERRRRGEPCNGLFEYRLVVRKDDDN